MLNGLKTPLNWWTGKRMAPPCFKALVPGRQLQISKYAHEWTPTMHHWAQISNKIDWRCFACDHLKENVRHMLLCPSAHQQAAHSKAINEFCTHLWWYHTPAPMSSIIIDCLQQAMALWQLTHHSTPTYQWQRSKCQPPLTHQWSIQWPKHHWMGPLPLRPNCISMAMSNCVLLPRETTGTFLQPSTVGKKNHWPSVDHILNHLAMPQWRTIQKRLWRTVIYSPPDNTWQSKSHLWESQRQRQPWTHNHTALATNHGSLEVDKMPPRCIPSNSQSVPGTNCWPRLILQERLLGSQLKWLRLQGGLWYDNIMSI
jgi:hypothetical protein